MKNLFTLFVILLFLWGNSFGKDRPNYTYSTATGPTSGNQCSSCTVQNADWAWDNDESSYCNLDIDPSAQGGWASATYQFPVNLDKESFTTIRMSIGGPTILSGAISDFIFERITLEFRDAQNNLVVTYDSTNRVAVELVSSATNTFNLHIINQSPDNRQVRIIAHSLGFPLAEEIRIHDISWIQRTFGFVLRPISSGSGFSGGACGSVDGAGAGV